MQETVISIAVGILVGVVVSFILTAYYIKISIGMQFWRRGIISRICTLILALSLAGLLMVGTVSLLKILGIMSHDNLNSAGITAGTIELFTILFINIKNPINFKEPKNLETVRQSEDDR